MYTISLNNNPHEFEKVNLVTMEGNFDILKCKRCGLVGKTVSLTTLSVKGSFSRHKVYNCTSTEEEIREKMKGKKIVVTVCTAHGKAFGNITPNSVHQVIETPENQSVDNKGVWVMGVGEPVKLLNTEFNYVQVD